MPIHSLKQLIKTYTYFSSTHMITGFVGVMVGFTSSVVLVFQAALAAGASHAEIASWLFALGSSIAITCMGFSWYYRMPILIGWSTPGAALLVTSLSGLSMPEAVAAFMIAAFLTMLSGMTGLFEKLMHYIPRSLSAAMLAGILLQFGLNIFISMQQQVLLVSSMLLTYLIGKRLSPRYVILFVLIVGICVAKIQGLFHLPHLPQHGHMQPIWTFPQFSTSTIFSVGIPLFIVTMTAQNIPGLAVLHAAGFRPPISSLMRGIGFVNLIFAPFGCFSISLTALTAAICAGPEADLDPAKRYHATIFAGLCWLCVGIFGTTLVSLFFAFPQAWVLAIAGLALLSTLGNSLKTALEHDSEREPALITILVSASGLSLWGIGGAFLGLAAGLIATAISRARTSLDDAAFPAVRSILDSAAGLLSMTRR